MGSIHWFCRCCLVLGHWSLNPGPHSVQQGLRCWTEAPGPAPFAFNFETESHLVTWTAFEPQCCSGLPWGLLPEPRATPSLTHTGLFWKQFFVTLTIGGGHTGVCISTCVHTLWYMCICTCVCIHSGTNAVDRGQFELVLSFYHVSLGIEPWMSVLAAGTFNLRSHFISLQKHFLTDYIIPILDLSL